MEFSKNEQVAVDQAVSEVNQVADLADLELALVGGGMGEIATN